MATSYNIVATLKPTPTVLSALSQGYAAPPHAAYDQADFEQRIGFMLAIAAGGAYELKRDTTAFFDRVRKIAELALDEVFDLRTMALNRPDDNQMAVLESQIASARSANGLSELV